MKIYVCNVMNGLVGLSGHQRRVGARGAEGAHMRTPKMRKNPRLQGYPRQPSKILKKNEKK